MRFGFLAIAVLLLGLSSAQADTVIVESSDGSQTDGSGSGAEPVNPCAPETFDATECITPE